jgi:hypothetical protein
MRASVGSFILLLVLASSGDAQATDVLPNPASITGALRITGFSTFGIDAAEGLKKILGLWIDKENGSKVRLWAD